MSTDTDRKHIHFHMRDPTKALFKRDRSRKAAYLLISCEKSDECSLYARGECIRLRSFGGQCKYGRYQWMEGYTRRARKFRKWMNEQRKAFEHVGSLSPPKHPRVSRVGDYIWLPYPFMDVVLAGGKSVLFSKQIPFVPVEEWTVDLIVTLCNGSPQAVFGGTIKDYQSESVPLFVRHLKEDYPDMLREAAEKSSRIRTVLKGLTNVGRKAYLKTLKPNVGTYTHSKKEWVWDGTHLVGEDGVFLPVKGLVKILPEDGATIVVTDDAQVQESTQFVD